MMFLFVKSMTDFNTVRDMLLEWSQLIRVFRCTPPTQKLGVKSGIRITFDKDKYLSKLMLVGLHAQTLNGVAYLPSHLIN